MDLDETWQVALRPENTKPHHHIIIYSFKIRLSYRNPNNVATKKCKLNNEILYSTHICKFKIRNVKCSVNQ